jgi:hypothetical protein
MRVVKTSTAREAKMKAGALADLAKIAPELGVHG